MSVGQGDSTRQRQDGSVDAVFFDLFGTLLDLAGLVDECEAAAPGRGRELAVRWRQRQLEFSWLRTTMGAWADFDRVTADALEGATAELDLTLDAATAKSLASAFERLPVVPAAPGVLSRVRASGMATGVLTNASNRTLDLVIARTGLTDSLDHSISVDEAGRFKPDPAVYRLASEATGLDAGRVSFVTANGWDAAGAGSFGFRVFWLQNDRSATFPLVGAPAPTAVTWGTLGDVLLAAARAG